MNNGDEFENKLCPLCREPVEIEETPQVDHEKEEEEIKLPDCTDILKRHRPHDYIDQSKDESKDEEEIKTKP